MTTHVSQDLVRLFDTLFFTPYNTRLIGGGAEPLYRPASITGAANEIVFREDYFASALHEVAHWCIAGEQRRRQPDYGYWYAPDGRTPAQQQLFEQVEARPQALEWIFSAAAGYGFRLSLDNLGGQSQASLAFKTAVLAQVQQLLRGGMGARAERFTLALLAAYGGDLAPAQFCLAALA